jgi:hypothetical protein
MEFFRILKIKTRESDIQAALTLENLSSMSNEIFVVGNQDKKEADIGGIWGEFTLARSEVKGGLRFALLECPNALAWTITTGFPPDPYSIILHLTINRQEKESSFIEEVEEFLDDHMDCLTTVFSHV